jgi:uncharacterized protein
MPPFKEHLETSKKRTGREHRQVHEWIDVDPEKKDERHDLVRISKNYQHVLKAYGKAAARELLHHITEDIEKKTMEIELLRETGVPEEAIQHSLNVAEKALEIAARVEIKNDAELIRKGALFHDIGKSHTYEIEHGKIGAEIAARLGMPSEVIAIIEKHIRGGMSREEAEALGLPVKDYALKTSEEKIAIYSDRLVDIIQDKVADDEEAELKFEEILRKYEKYGKNPKTMGRYIKLHREIRDWMKR